MFMAATLPLENLSSVFGENLQTDVSLARYTAARVGGPADVLLLVKSAPELAEAAQQLWTLDVPFVIFGGGSNILVSDAGIREVVLLNRARQLRFDQAGAERLRHVVPDHVRRVGHRRAAAAPELHREVLRFLLPVITYE